MTKREPTENRRRQIADAALSIVAAYGHGRHRSRGITEGAIFRHFASKEEIVLAAIDRVEELFEEDAPGDVGEPLVRLKKFIEHRVRVAHENGGISRLVFSDELSSAAEGRGSVKVRATRDRAAATIRRCLVEARERDQIAADLDLDAAALLILGHGPRLQRTAPPAACGRRS